jgi:CBS domain-containing protein
MGTKKVREAMSRDPRSVGESTSVQEAARMMKEQDVGSLPVVEDERLVGIVTDRDIVIRGVAVRSDVSSLSVMDVASHGVTTVAPDQDLDEALRLMAQEQVRRLPVVDGDRLVGILAQADVAREGDEERVGETVEQISQ